MASGIDVWSLVNQTIMDMNGINNLQSQSTDPSDMGAYNLTTYGMQSIHDIQSHVIGPVSQLQGLYERAIHQYDLPYDPISNQSSGQSLVNGNSLLSPILSNPSSLLPTHNIVTLAVLIVFAFLMVRSILPRK